MPRGQRRTGVPNKTDRAERPQRVTVGMARSQFELTGKDPDFTYRWVLDKDAKGEDIKRYLDLGWSFAPQGSLNVGERYVTTTDDVEGEIVRRPDGTSGRYLFLMYIRKDWADEARAAYDRLVDSTEDALFYKGDDDPEYIAYDETRLRRT